MFASAESVRSGDWVAFRLRRPYWLFGFSGMVRSVKLFRLPARWTREKKSRAKCDE